jgi:hypothetical protein
MDETCPLIADVVRFEKVTTPSVGFSTKDPPGRSIVDGKPADEAPNVMIWKLSPGLGFKPLIKLTVSAPSSDAADLCL